MAGEVMRVAYVEGAPNEAARERVLSARVDGISVHVAGALDPESISWIDRFECRYLEIVAIRLPVIPLAARIRLEHLQLVGRFRAIDALRVDELPRVKTLSVDQGYILGEYGYLGQLESLRLGKVRNPELGQLAGCRKIESVRFECVRGRPNELAILDPGTVLPNLSEVTVENGRLETLEGVERLPGLRRLVVTPTSIARPLPTLDVSRLSGAVELERLAIGMNGRLVGIEKLGALSSLAGLTAVRGWVDESRVGHLPIIWNAPPRY
ncbi:hypothetical protein ACWFNS_04190 [Oerskovia enterophila]